MSTLLNTFLFSEPEEHSINFSHTYKRGEYPSCEEIKRLYWDKQLSRNEIAKLYGVHLERVRSWMKHLDIPTRVRKEYTLLSAHPLQPNLSPSIALAYVLGVLYGDGHVRKKVTDGNYLICLSVRSKKFAESFASSLKSINLNPSIRCKLRTTKINSKKYARYFWITIAYSRKFVKWYNSLTAKTLLNYVKLRNHKIAFLKGLYESEGSFGYWKMGTSRTWIFRIVMLNRMILQLARRLLKDLGYAVCLTHNHRTETNKQLYSLEKKGIEALNIIRHIAPCIKGETCDASVA